MVETSHGGDQVGIITSKNSNYREALLAGYMILTQRKINVSCKTLASNKLSTKQIHPFPKKETKHMSNKKQTSYTN